MDIDSKKTLEWCIDNRASCYPERATGETIFIIAKCDDVVATHTIEAPFDPAAIGRAVLSAFSSVETGVKHFAKLKEDLGVE